MPNTIRSEHPSEKPDDLQNPLMLTPLSPPEDILTPVVVNMHTEERQGRKIAWIMDDLHRDIAKLRVIFVERLTEPTEKVPESFKNKPTPDMSHEILKNLSAISDWLADIQIDGETFALPITGEEMKAAQEKPLERKAFVTDKVNSMQKVLEEVVEKTIKLAKFISGRQNTLEKFCEHVGDKNGDEDEGFPKGGTELLRKVLDSLRKIDYENIDEIEDLVLGYHNALIAEKNNTKKLSGVIKTLKKDVQKFYEVVKTVNLIKEVTGKFVKETEATLARVISDESVRLSLAASFGDFKNKFKKEFNAFSKNTGKGFTFNYMAEDSSF